MSDFELGLLIGGLVGIVISFVDECMCIISGRSDIDTWMYEEEEDDELN